MERPRIQKAPKTGHCDTAQSRLLAAVASLTQSVGASVRTPCKESLGVPSTSQQDQELQQYQGVNLLHCPGVYKTFNQVESGVDFVHCYQMLGLNLSTRLGECPEEVSKLMAHCSCPWRRSTVL